MNYLRKKHIIRDFDKAAKSYDEYAFVQRKVADYLFSLIKAQISSSMLTLDAGCGTGYFHELLRKNKIYCPLVQTDIAFAMCKKADEYASPDSYGGTYSCASDVESLPLADNVIDLVFSSLTLQWVRDINIPMAEMYRVLKEGGRIAISTTAAGTLRELTSSFAKMDNLHHINDNFVDADSLNRVLKRCGFSNIKIFEKTITAQHDNLRDMLYSIKGVGAGYKTELPRKYLGKNYFAELEELYYANFAVDNMLPASWNIIYAVAEK